MYMGTQ